MISVQFPQKEILIIMLYIEIYRFENNVDRLTLEFPRKTRVDQLITKICKCSPIGLFFSSLST